MEANLNSKNIDNLGILEKKILALVEAVKLEKQLNRKLEIEKIELLQKLEQLENTLLKENNSMQELNNEKAMTKMMVEELINNIDKLVEEERQLEKN